MRERYSLRVVFWVGLGLLVGLSLGLYAGWVVWPLANSEAEPADLEDDYKIDYVIMVAAAYEEEGDLQAATRRIRTLGRTDVAEWVASVTVEHILTGGPEEEIRQLAGLAAALGADTPAMVPFLTPSTSDVADP